MSVIFGDHIDLAQKELRNALAQSLVADPATPQEGQFWWRSDLDELRYYDGAATQTIRTMALITDADIADGTISLAKLSTDPLARANHTGTQLAATISDFDDQVQTSSLDELAAPAADVDLNSHKLTGLATPTDSDDAATKAYVDGLAQGLDAKQSVRAASTVDVAIDGHVPTTAMDGVTLAAGNRILLKNQTNPAENGIYDYDFANAMPGGRAADMDSWADVPSAFVFVEEGTVNADTGWVCTTNAGGTLETTAIAFTQFSGAGQIVAGAALTKTGNQLDVGVDGSTIEVSSDALRVKDGGITSAKIADATIVHGDIAAANKDGIAATPSLRTLGDGAQQAAPGDRVPAPPDENLVPVSNEDGTSTWVSPLVFGMSARVATIGDGSTTSFSIPHDLNTEYVLVLVSDGGQPVLTTVTVVDDSTVEVSFAVAPSVGQYQVLIFG